MMISSRQLDGAGRAAITEQSDSDEARPTTYAALNDKRARMASYLQATTGARGRVAILGDDSVSYLAALLGAVRAGCVAVPLSPRQGPQVATIIDDAAPELVIADEACTHPLPPDWRCVVLGSDAPGPHPAGLPTPPNSVGAVQPGAEVRIVDGPTDHEGRLIVRTPASMSGYHNHDAAGDTLHDGWYDTRDVVRVEPDGFFRILGRADDMIICGGENIYPA
jgi:acyl-CoA synthetase (AMP-forming)/AMP-acid ligase II